MRRRETAQAPHHRTPSDHGGACRSARVRRRAGCRAHRGRGRRGAGVRRRDASRREWRGVDAYTRRVVGPCGATVGAQDGLRSGCVRVDAALPTSIARGAPRSGSGEPTAGHERRCQCPRHSAGSLDAGVPGRSSGGPACATKTTPPGFTRCSSRLRRTRSATTSRWCGLRWRWRPGGARGRPLPRRLQPEVVMPSLATHGTGRRKTKAPGRSKGKSPQLRPPDEPRDPSAPARRAEKRRSTGRLCAASPRRFQRCRAPGKPPCSGGQPTLCRGTMRRESVRRGNSLIASIECQSPPWQAWRQQLGWSTTSARRPRGNKLRGARPAAFPSALVRLRQLR